MRIIGGELRGRRFHPPADKWPTRPTTDFAREGLFNILSNRLDFSKIRMLDLFGGTGSHSLEAISRGCKQVVYVEKHRPCHAYLTKLTKELKVNENISMIQTDVKKYLEISDNQHFDYVFAGPPYPLPWIPEIPDLLLGKNILKPDGIFVLEHNNQHNFRLHPNFEQIRQYGDTHFTFFSVNQSFAG